MKYDIDTHLFLNRLVEKYEVYEFVNKDPIQFPRIYKRHKRDAEIVAFLCSVISWGNRKTIINDCCRLLKNITPFNGALPYDYVMRGKYDNVDDNACVHRTSKWKDIKYLMRGLKRLYEMTCDAGMELLFSHDNNDIWGNISTMRQIFIEANDGETNVCFPSPQTSPCKRLMMMLRWLVRKDSVVDMGIWKDVSPSKLIIPLDVHVFNSSLELGLTEHTNVSRKTAEDITCALREYDRKDPCRYDFALFGYGIHKNNIANDTIRTFKK